MYRSRTRPRTLAGVISEIYQLYGITHCPNAERWGDKTPMLAQHLPAVADTFSDAQFIHIIRNPYDAIASNVDVFGVSVADATARYHRDVGAIQEFGWDNPRFMEISYEHLVQQPYARILQICWFLNIEFVEDMLRPYKWAPVMGDTTLPPHKRLHRPIGTDRIESWQSRLTTEQADELRGLLEWGFLS